MDDEIEPKTVNQQPPRRDISRRMVMVGLAGLATTEAVAGKVRDHLVDLLGQISRTAQSHGALHEL